MLFFSPSPPLLLSGLVGPVLLGLGLSAGAFAAIAVFALNRVSRDSGESPLVLLGRARGRVRSLVSRARVRVRTGAARSSWQVQRPRALRVGGAVLAAEAVLGVGMATSAHNWLGAGATAFAATVTVLAGLLANGVLLLLWLAGPMPEARFHRAAPAQDAQALPGNALRRLLGRRTNLALPQAQTPE